MDQRRDRGRALHRIGQPHVQRHLGALAHGTDEQQQADHRHHQVLGAAEQRHGPALDQMQVGEHLGVVQGAEVVQDAGDAEQEAEVANPVDQERLQVGEHRAGPLEPEADQQVGHQADRFPAEEQLQEVVGHHQHQHGECEQGDVAEEALVAPVVGHVADGVDVHHQRDEGHHHHHHRGQPVDHEADVGAQPTDLEPGVDVLVVALRASPGQQVQHVAGQRERHADAKDGHGVGAGAADLAAEQAGDDGAEQRRQHDGEKQVLADHGVPAPSPSSGRVRRR